MYVHLKIGCVSPFPFPDLGYSADCSNSNAFDLAPVDLGRDEVPLGYDPASLFVSCVPETTDDDVRQARAYATGAPVPRLLVCPFGRTFNAQSGQCEGDIVYPDY